MRVCVYIISHSQSSKVQPLLSLATEISQRPKYVIIYQQIGLWSVSCKDGHEKEARASNFLSLTFQIIFINLIIMMDERFIYHVNYIAATTCIIIFITLKM
jgi:hypothetical protein